MSAPAIKTLVYATSLGKHTRPVFRHAVSLAKLYNARIIMLHAIEPMAELGKEMIRAYVDEQTLQRIHDEGIQDIQQTMLQRVKTFCEEELDALPGIIELDIEPVVVEGNHTDAILNTAKRYQADLIVMGAQNKSGHHSHTTQQVTRYAQVPVLVVPTE